MFIDISCHDYIVVLMLLCTCVTKKMATHNVLMLSKNIVVIFFSFVCSFHLYF